MPSILKPKEFNSHVGDFGIVKTLGAGASCTVKLAFHKDSDKPVAIKIMNGEDMTAMELMQ